MTNHLSKLYKERKYMKVKRVFVYFNSYKSFQVKIRNLYIMNEDISRNEWMHSKIRKAGCGVICP